MRRFFTAVVIIVASFAVARILAQQPPPAAPAASAPSLPGAPATPATPAAPAKPLVPVAASTLAAHPEAYYGENVSLTGTVEQLLSKFAFSIDQGKTRSNGLEVLIVAPTLQLPVDANTYITVLGEVVKFDPAEIATKAKDYKNDLAPDVVAKFQGRPAIIATSVINSAGLDIAKRLPPPMTTEEQDFQKVMREVGPANAALRSAIDKADAAAIKEQAAVLTKAFTQTEMFWKARGKADAVKWATDARTMTESIDKAIVAGKWDDAKTTVGTLGQQCQSCHGTYRERFDDGSFRIKIGIKVGR